MFYNMTYTYTATIREKVHVSETEKWFYLQNLPKVINFIKRF